MGRKLYVGNLPYETGETELQELFARAGTVETVRVMRDMATGRARGFAFVEMSTEQEAKAAVEQLSGRELGGRTIDEALAQGVEVQEIWRAVCRTVEVAPKLR